MDCKRTKKNEKELLIHFDDFLKKIIDYHHLENLSEFILHELCARDFFNIQKAAYFVNNHSFACLKGVAGYHHQEAFNEHNRWNKYKEFTSHMKNTNFNNAVRSIESRSFHIDDYDTQKKVAKEISDKLHMKNSQIHTWNMKHDNHGLFIFEKDLDVDYEYLPLFLQFFSLSPIF